MMKNSFKKNGIELIHGDCFDVLPTLEKRSCDACITDPPYNISAYEGKREIGWLKSNKYWTREKKFSRINEEWDKFSNLGYEKFTEKWLQIVCDLVKPNGNLIIFGTYHNIYLIGYLLQKLSKKIINSIVWYKRNAFPNITHRMLCESTEYMVWAVNNDNRTAKNWTFNYKILKKMNEGKQMRNMWDIPSTLSKIERKFGKHPAQKPSRVVERLILGSTNIGDTVLDPFIGSGTIPLVCKVHKRKSIGIEIDKRYFDIAKKRLENVTSDCSLERFTE